MNAPVSILEGRRIAEDTSAKVDTHRLPLLETDGREQTFPDAPVYTDARKRVTERLTVERKGHDAFVEVQVTGDDVPR